AEIDPQGRPVVQLRCVEVFAGKEQATQELPGHHVGGAVGQNSRHEADQERDCCDGRGQLPPHGSSCDPYGNPWPGDCQNVQDEHIARQWLNIAKRFVSLKRTFDVGCRVLLGWECVTSIVRRRTFPRYFQARTKRSVHVPLSSGACCTLKV